MIKKLSTLLILLVIGAASAFAINETLAQAQAALKGASTEQQFAHALTLFKSAANDINYNPDTDDRAIADGKAQCNRRLSALRKRLRVDNSAQALSRSFSNQGGSLTFSVTDAAGAVKVAQLPDWLTLDSNNGSQIVVSCGPNASTIVRQGLMKITDGKYTVSISLNQAGAPRPAKRPVDDGRTRSKLQINDLKFTNVAWDNSIITPAGQPLYAHEMRFLRPLISYDGLAQDKNAYIHVRIYKPDGSLMQPKDIAPDGDTQYYDYQFFAGENNDMGGMMGFGHRRDSEFEPGQYRYEIWIDDENVYTAYATIVEREDNETYLLVNGESAPTIALKPTGGTVTYYVSTSDANWEVTDLPSFMTLSKKTDDSFTATYKANRANAPREEYFYIEGAGRRVKVNVTQETSGPVATLENVTVQHGVVVDGEKGLEIHAKINILNANRHRVQVVAWFYYADGEPLMDIDGQYRAGDGQVTVNKDIVIDSDRLDLPDFTLFIPYSQLDITDPGDTEVEFDMGIYDFAKRDFLASSPRIKFTYSN